MAERRKGDISSSYLLDEGIADSRDSGESNAKGSPCSFHNPRTRWKCRPLKQVILDISLYDKVDLIITCNLAKNGGIRSSISREDGDGQ